METHNQLKVLMAVLILGMIVLGYYFHMESQEIVEVGGINISRADLQSIINPLPEGAFALCSIKEDKCIRLYKGG